jgi:hypothetical protein
MDKNDQYKSLDHVANTIQPSLEPENNTNIDRQLDTPVREVELQPETSGIQIEPELDFGDTHNEPELDFGEQMDITAEQSEPEHVHVPEPQVDEITANMAPTSGSHGGPVSEMPLLSEMIPPQSDSPSEPQSLYIAPQNPARQSERLKTKPRRRWDTRLHFARAAKATTKSNKFDLEPQSFEEAMASPFAREWELAIIEELEALNKNKTWNTRKSLPRNKRAIKNKWVFKRKLNPDNTTRFKARLVIKGYEQRYGIDFKETFAPVVNFRTVKVLLALAATLDLEMHQMDVKTAFLNGELEEEIYM